MLNCLMWLSNAGLSYNCCYFEVWAYICSHIREWVSRKSSVFIGIVCDSNTCLFPFLLIFRWWDWYADWSIRSTVLTCKLLWMLLLLLSTNSEFLLKLFWDCIHIVPSILMLYMQYLLMSVYMSVYWKLPLTRWHRRYPGLSRFLIFSMNQLDLYFSIVSSVQKLI